LLLGFQADDRLVHKHVVENTAERVPDVVVLNGRLDGFAEPSA
jgi:hypothetical protein